MVRFIPNNVKDIIGGGYFGECECPESSEDIEDSVEVVEPEVAEQEVVEPEVDINESVNILLNNQGTIYNDMISSFAQLQQMVSDLETTCSAQPAVVPAEPVIDEKEQQRLELQAQIEALQAQMQSL